MILRTQKALQIIYSKYRLLSVCTTHSEYPDITQSRCYNGGSAVQLNCTVKRKCSGKTMSQDHFAYQKFQTDWPEFELGSSVVRQLAEPCFSVPSFLQREVARQWRHCTEYRGGGILWGNSRRPVPSTQRYAKNCLLHHVPIGTPVRGLSQLNANVWRCMHRALSYNTYMNQ